MISLSIALVIVAAIAGFLVNKFIDIKYKVNNEPVIVTGTTVAINEMHKHFDGRINKAFENHQQIKLELDSLKLQLGLKANNGR